MLRAFTAHSVTRLPVKSRYGRLKRYAGFRLPQPSFAHVGAYESANLAMLVRSDARTSIGMPFETGKSCPLWQRSVPFSIASAPGETPENGRRHSGQHKTSRA